MDPQPNRLEILLRSIYPAAVLLTICCLMKIVQLNDPENFDNKRSGRAKDHQSGWSSDRLTGPRVQEVDD